MIFTYLVMINNKRYSKIVPIITTDCRMIFYKIWNEIIAVGRLYSGIILIRNQRSYIVLEEYHSAPHPYHWRQMIQQSYLACLSHINTKNTYSRHRSKQSHYYTWVVANWFLSCGQEWQELHQTQLDSNAWRREKCVLFKVVNRNEYKVLWVHFYVICMNVLLF